MNFNYYINYKSKKNVVTSSLDYLIKVNNLSKKLKMEKYISENDLKKIDTLKSSAWVIHSKKNKRNKRN